MPGSAVTRLDREDLARLVAEGQPFVSVGRRDDAGGPVPYVGADYPQATADLVRPADRHLNPGAGHVSRLCHGPRVAVAVIEALLAPYRGSARLRVLQPYRPTSADVDGDRVTAVTLAHRDSGETTTVVAPSVLDATETGELLPLTGTEYVTGFGSRADTGEPGAPEEAQPKPPP
jgi:hypothetical protein